MFKKIHIERFKSIKSADLDLFKNNFLIGQNGAGKTTLLSSIYLLRLLAKGQNVNTTASIIAPAGSELFFEAHIEQPIMLAYELVVGEPSVTYKLELTLTLASQGELKINHETLSQEVGETWKLIYKRRLDDFKAEVNGELKSVPLAVKETELALSTFSSEHTRKIVGALSSGIDLWSDISPKNPQFSIQSPEIEHNDSIDWLVVALINDPEDSKYGQAMESITKILPHFKAPQPIMLNSKSAKKDPSDSEEVAKSKRYAVFWPLRFSEGDDYTIASLSNGERKVIQVILSLYHAKPQSTVTIEEIENGLHPTRVRDLIHLIKYLAIKRGVQLIVTTHSTHVLDALMPAELVIVQYKDGGSIYQRATQTKEFEMVKEELGHEPTAQELANSGVLL